MFESKEEYATLHFAAVKKYIEYLEQYEICRHDLDRMNCLIGYMKAFEETLESLPYDFEIK